MPPAIPPSPQAATPGGLRFGRFELQPHERRLLVDGEPVLLGESPRAAAPGDEFFEEGDTEVVNTIKQLLDTRVRPAVAQDGGDITFQGFREGVVFLNMKGSCAGCPSSTATLKHGIENLLRHFVPEVSEVRAV